MSRLFASTGGPDDWKRLLADPETQWRVGFWAHSLAHAWEAADRHLRNGLSELRPFPNPALAVMWFLGREPLRDQRIFIASAPVAETRSLIASTVEAMGFTVCERGAHSAERFEETMVA